MRPALSPPVACVVWYVGIAASLPVELYARRQVQRIARGSKRARHAAVKVAEVQDGIAGAAGAVCGDKEAVRRGRADEAGELLCRAERDAPAAAVRRVRAPIARSDSDARVRAARGRHLCPAARRRAARGRPRRNRRGRLRREQTDEERRIDRAALEQRVQAVVESLVNEYLGYFGFLLLFPSERPS